MNYIAVSFAQALVSFKKCMPPPPPPPLLPYFKVNICPFSPSPQYFSLICDPFADPIISLHSRYFSFRLPHLNISTGLSSDELDKNIQRTSLGLLFSHWNGYNHFRSGLNWFRKLKKRCFKNQMSVIWSWTYFYNLHWNNYLYFKGLLYIWEEMIMMALLHMAGLENSEYIWKIQRKPKWLYPFQWLKSRPNDVRWIFLSNSSEGSPVGIFKCGSRKEKYLGSVTI